MNLTIIGASGGVGLYVVKQALAKGHHVTTLSRSIDNIADHVLLKKIKGTATSVDDVKQSIQKADALIITIGMTRDKNVTLFRDAARAIAEAMQGINSNVPVIAITGFGVGESYPYASGFLKIVIRLMLRKEFDDRVQLEKIFAGSDLQWQIVRPGLLTNGPYTGKYKPQSKLSPGMKIKSISRADVADYLLSQAENPTNTHQYVALSY